MFYLGFGIIWQLSIKVAFGEVAQEKVIGWLQGNPEKRKWK